MGLILSFNSSSKSTIIIIGIVSGVITGYLGASYQYSIYLKNYSLEIDSLESNISKSIIVIEDKNENISTLQSQIQTYEILVSEMMENISRLNHELIQIHIENEQLYDNLKLLEGPYFEVLGITLRNDGTRFDLINIGGITAHDVNIKVRVEIVSGLIAVISHNVSISQLEPFEVQSGFVPVGRSNFPDAVVNSVELLISCREGISKVFKASIGGLV